MLFVALIAVAVLYAALYLAWLSAQSHLGAALPLLGAFYQMIFTPEPLIFILLRGLILVTLLYIVGDFILSTTKSGLRKSKKEEFDHAKSGLTTKPDAHGKKRSKSSEPKHSLS